MIKKILSFGAIEGLARGANWLLLIVLAMILPASEYGVLALILAIEGTLIPFLLLGQDRSVLRFYHDSSFESSDVLTKITKIFFIFSIIISFMLFVFLYMSNSETLYGLTVFPYGYIFVVSLVFLSFIKLYLSVVRVEAVVVTYAYVRIGNQVIKACALIVIMMMFKEVDYYPVVSLIVVLVIALPIIRGYVGRCGRVVNNKNDNKRLILFGAPLIFHVLSGSILSYIDRFFIDYYMDEASVGVYTLAYMLGSSITLIFGLTAIYFEPYVYKKHQEEVGAMEYSLNLYSRVLFVIVSVVGLVLLVFSYEFLQDVFGEDYALASGVVPIVLMSHIIHIIYLQANYRLTALEKTGTIAMGTVTAAVINSLANVVLIPKMGLLGAAYATFISYFFLAFFMFVISYYRAGDRLSLLKSALMHSSVLMLVLMSIIMNTMLTYYSVLVVISIAFVFYVFKYDYLRIRKILAQ